MPSEWKATCKDCRKTFTYSDAVLQERALRGLSAPERCSEHRNRHAMETREIASSHFGLEPRQRPNILGAPFLGSFDRSDRQRPEVHEFTPDPSGMDLGLTNDHLAEVYAALETHRALVIVAPTGAGKSTVIPYRLLAPAPGSGLPPNHFTRHGRKIVVTQPRRDATSSIPETIARKMHGSTVGPGSEIGFRHSQDRDRTDPWNRLIFVTDGTLANWLIDQRAGEFSVVIVDEAHERSATIDLILGLMRAELLRHPHLRLIVLSATIHAERFQQFFEAALPGQVWLKDFADCQKSHGYEVRWPPEATEVTQAQMVEAATVKVLELLGSTTDGEILVFMPGEGEIRSVVDGINKRLPRRLEGQVAVEPFYGALSPGDRERVKQPVKANRKGVVPRRVVVATNLAETSLTLPAVTHVIDTGLIKESAWDPVSRTESLPLQWHSQAGCRQRWGRAGRNRPGIVHPLYTQSQFDGFEPYTKPAVARECLDEVLVKAKRAGITSLEDFPWLDSPPRSELDRVAGLATERRYVDAEGDLTERGSETFDLYQRIGRFVGEGAGAAARGLDMASLLMLADRYGCLIEAATLLVIQRRLGERLYARDREGRHQGLLTFEATWPLEKIDQVARLHQALRAGCRDDLDFGLKLVALAEGVRVGDCDYGGPAWAGAACVNLEIVREAIAERDQIIEFFNRQARGAPIRAPHFELFDRLRLVIGIAWPDMVGELMEGGRWRAPRAEAGGLVSIHSVCRMYRGEAVIAAFGRRESDEDGTYTSDAVASVVIRADCSQAALDDIDVAAEIHALRHRRSDARERLLADVERPIDEPLGDKEPGRKIVRWLTGVDGVPVPETTPIRPVLMSEDVTEGEAFEVYVERTIPFIAKDWDIGIVGVVGERTVYVDVSDISFGSRAPAEMFVAGSILPLAVVNRSQPTPRLSLLPSIEAGWNTLVGTNTLTGIVTELLPRRDGETAVRMAVQDPGLPRINHLATCTLGHRHRKLLSTLSVGEPVHFSPEPVQAGEWSWSLGEFSDSADQGYATHEARRLSAFGVELVDGVLRTKTRLSVEEMYSAIQVAPSLERAVRALFQRSHNLSALPDSLETATSLNCALTRGEQIKALWFRAWEADVEGVRETLRAVQEQVREEPLSARAYNQLAAALDEVWQITGARKDKTTGLKRAADQRAWATRGRDSSDRFIASKRANIAKNRADVQTSRSATFIARATEWIANDEAKLAVVLRERSDLERRWVEALWGAERLESQARAADAKLAALRGRVWSWPFRT